MAGVRMYCTLCLAFAGALLQTPPLAAQPQVESSSPAGVGASVGADASSVPGSQATTVQGVGRREPIDPRTLELEALEQAYRDAWPGWPASLAVGSLVLTLYAGVVAAAAIDGGATTKCGRRDACYQQAAPFILLTGAGIAGLVVSLVWAIHNMAFRSETQQQMAKLRAAILHDAGPVEVTPTASGIRLQVTF